MVKQNRPGVFNDEIKRLNDENRKFSNNIEKKNEEFESKVKEELKSCWIFAHRSVLPHM